MKRPTRPLWDPILPRRGVPWPGKQYLPARLGKPRLPMTVCVAVVAKQNTIVCVSDRMLSVLGMEFEPPTSKMFHLGDACACLYAGDGGFAVEVVSLTAAALERDGEQPRTPARAAQHFATAYRTVVHERIDASVLAALGIRVADLRTPDGTINRDTRREGLRLLRTYQAPPLQMIIAGVSRDGQAQLYVADDGVVQGANVPGFAAIGGGRDHAYTQLMLGGCDAGMERSDALVLAYAAKRRADAIVGGVGTSTDVLELGPGPTCTPWLPSSVNDLEQVYQQWAEREREGLAYARDLARQVFPASGEPTRRVRPVAPPAPTPPPTTTRE